MRKAVGVAGRRPVVTIIGCMTEVSSIVLFSANSERTIRFYESLGIAFELEDHGDGRLHAATDVGDVHVAVFPAPATGSAPGWRADGSTFVGFYVESLNDTLVALGRLGATVVLDHEVCEWGCRVVVEDPDGRPVEINERGHCAVSGTD